jgi:DNA primase
VGLVAADSLEAIRSKLDIVELVSDYVSNLQNSGKGLKGLCPFHEERTPSFIVSPERQTFHCFGCGEGGDVFSFLMKIEKLGFIEAVEKLAERAGVSISSGEKNDPKYKERSDLKAALDFAAAFYHEQLLRSPAAEKARRYLLGRQVSDASVSRFRIGYVPSSNAFLDAAKKKGFSESRLIDSGLAVRLSGGVRPSFFGRILFPIRDNKGATVGFGGRALEAEAQPKYLNSAESPLFSKSRVLYGIYEGLSAIREKREICLMEGYLDVIAAHQHGLETACAPLGTALTADHARLAKRYGASVVIAFDPDRAGIDAALRSADILLSCGVDARIASIPDGKDPDEFFNEKGPAAFRLLLDQALDPAAFKTEILIAKQKTPLSPELKSEIARQIFEVISRSSDEVVKSEWSRGLSQRLRIPEEPLRLEFAKQATKKNYAQGNRLSPVSTEVVPSKNPPTAFERQILCLMIKNPALASLANEGNFQSRDARTVWKALAFLDATLPGWPSRLLENAGDARPLASELLMIAESIEEGEPQQELEHVFGKKRLEARLQDLEGRIHLSPGDVHPELREEYQKVVCELKGSRG